MSIIACTEQIVIYYVYIFYNSSWLVKLFQIKNEVEYNKHETNYTNLSSRSLFVLRRWRFM